MIQRIPNCLSMALTVLCWVAVSAQADTLQRIQQNQTLTLGFVPNYAPFSSGDTQSAKGFTIDLCLQVGARLKQQLALPELTLRYQPVAIDDMLTAVADGRVDILCSPVDETLQRRKQVSFSLPVITSGLGVVVRRDAPQALLGPLQGQASEPGPIWRGTINQGLNRFSFAVLADTHSADWLRARMRALGLQSQLLTVDSSAQGIELVASGKADAFFDDRLVLLNQLAKHAQANELLIPAHLFDETPAALPIARGDEDFRLLVDGALSELFRSVQGDSLYSQYFGPTNAQTRERFRFYSRPE